MGKVQIEKKKRILDDFFKGEEVHLRYERFDGQMSPLVRRLNFERGDSVAITSLQSQEPTYTSGESVQVSHL